MHGRHTILALACGSLAEGMQALQQLVAVHIGLAFALEKISTGEVVLQLLHRSTGEELKGADVGNLLVLKHCQQLLDLA